MSLRVQIVNSSDHVNSENIQSLVNLLNHSDITDNTSVSHAVVSYQNAQSQFLKTNPDLIIYSGRTYEDPAATFEESKKWYSWLGSIDRPIFTICGSYQRLILSQGGRFTVGEPEQGYTLTHLRSHHLDVLHQDYPSSRTYIYNHHRNFIDTSGLPGNFDILGFTRNGLAMVKHKSRSIYGFQGHPEKAYACLGPEQSIAKEFSNLIFRKLLSLASPSNRFSN